MRCSRVLCFLVTFSAHAEHSRRSLAELLMHLQGAGAIFSVGRQHRCGSFCEGLGITLALTAIAPTDLTVVYASTLGAQPQPDRKLRALA